MPSARIQLRKTSTSSREMKRSSDWSQESMAGNEGSRDRIMFGDSWSFRAFPKGVGVLRALATPISFPGTALAPDALIVASSIPLSRQQYGIQSSAPLAFARAIYILVMTFG